MPDNGELGDDERQLYELVTRHFLAVCSEDALGNETVVTIDINGEQFTSRGLMINSLNYLNVYTYDSWSDKNIPVFEEGQKFVPSSLMMEESSTSPPTLLAEADLITLMDKNGIGTDATIAQHINTIIEREYAVKNGMLFEPTDLGLALVYGYHSLGFDLEKPMLRAKMEQEMKKISAGELERSTVLLTNLQMYKSIFVEVVKKSSKLEDMVHKYFKYLGETAGLL